jgi:hypothetical protein
LPPRKTLTLRPSPSQAAGGTWTSRKIAIVGCYPETWEKAPYSDKSWEIWGFSRRNMGKLPRCDKWFELHPESNFLRYESEVRGYSDWLKNSFVVLQDQFPAKELVKRFGPYFFSEGQSVWLMAYAIHLGATEIGIWGVECIDQYDKQRFEVQHFVQVARDMGISVTVPEGCTLLTPRKLYGFPPDLAK